MFMTFNLSTQYKEEDSSDVTRFVNEEVYNGHVEWEDDIDVVFTNGHVANMIGHNLIASAHYTTEIVICDDGMTPETDLIIGTIPYGDGIHYVRFLPVRDKHKMEYMLSLVNNMKVAIIYCNIRYVDFMTRQGFKPAIHGNNKNCTDRRFKTMNITCTPMLPGREEGEAFDAWKHRMLEEESFEFEDPNEDTYLIDITGQQIMDLKTDESDESVGNIFTHVLGKKLCIGYALDGETVYDPPTGIALKNPKQTALDLDLLPIRVAPDQYVFISDNNTVESIFRPGHLQVLSADSVEIFDKDKESMGYMSSDFVGLDEVATYIKPITIDISPSNQEELNIIDQKSEEIFKKRRHWARELKKYTHDSVYPHINYTFSHLLGQKYPKPEDYADGEYNDTVEYIVKAFVHAPLLQEDVVLQRGFKPEQWNQQRHARYVLNTGILSTTHHAPSDEFMTGNCCRMIINVPKGTPLYSMSCNSYWPCEGEYILSPGTLLEKIDESPLVDDDELGIRYQTTILYNVVNTPDMRKWLDINMG